ncbi:MAG: YceI family protein [Acidimicrobiales bacterium]|jgi:polyisoprenoid-binding protein YceI
MDDETAGDQAGPTRKRSLRWWIIGAVAVVVVLAVGGPFVYIHLIEGPAPGKLTLPGPSTGSTSATSAGSSGAGGDQVAGTWAVGPGSIVGYRVQEVLIGQHATAVGRTTKVSGTVTIDDTTVTAATVTVDMASVESDQSERNAQFDGRIMDVATYPTATLHLTAPLALGTVPAPGHAASYQGTGTLAMHGVTRTITLPLSAERIGTGIDVLAEIPIIFAGWNIANPSTGGFVTTASDGTLEVLLHLTRGVGNPAVTDANSTSTGSVGPGGPVTVPSTTVPPLTIPAGG